MNLLVSALDNDTAPAVTFTFGVRWLVSYYHFDGKNPAVQGGRADISYSITYCITTRRNVRRPDYLSARSRPAEENEEWKRFD